MKPLPSVSHSDQRAAGLRRVPGICCRCLDKEILTSAAAVVTRPFEGVVDLEKVRNHVKLDLAIGRAIGLVTEERKASCWMNAITGHTMIGVFLHP
ncbi:hypothetical protein NOJ05_19655 [Neorhizobium galegae]|uniref:hypothetical protein n=1 Tax=Neorhizobium galegae TaxID=399 RepID=UPI00210745BC|nr:hypothetical protein [Neorhizobium galegae]MCQ1779428.1 hypothetical protein [Neorhizobium galegae]MCQ1795588.1 hypothetical protein [Neorhizobium galegae]